MQDRGSRRTRRTEAQRAAIISRYRASGRTQADFARRAGLGLSTLRGWLRGERESLGEAESGPGFIEAIVAGDAARPADRAGRWYRVSVCGEVCVEVPAGFDPAEVRVLLRAVLEALPC